jgi:hypothetical protein
MSAVSRAIKEENTKLLAQIEELQGQIAALTKKANFNEGLRDIAMRDRGRMEATLREIAEFTSPLHEAGAIARKALSRETE